MVKKSYPKGCCPFWAEDTGSILQVPWFVFCPLPRYGPEEEGFLEQGRSQDLGPGQNSLPSLYVPAG